MGFARALFIAFVFFSIGVVFDVVPIQLPHPACHHRVTPLALHEEPGALTGVFAANTGLQSAKRFFKGTLHQSESIAISPSGDRLFFGDKFGAVYAGRLIEGKSLDIVLEPKEPLIQIPGRPLGLHALSDTELLICDAVNGLILADLTKRSHTVLTDKAKAHRRSKRTSKIVMANDLDVASDGAIYFTDSTDIPVDRGKDGAYSTFRTYMLNLLEGRASGRLLFYDREANTTRELMTQLWYANGVAVAKDGAFVAVVETNAFRVHRYWLKGARKGQSDVLIEHLPGFPDGMSTAPDGDFWIAVIAPPPFVWKLVPFHIIRLLYAWISEFIPLSIKTWGYVIKVSPQGDVRTVLSDIDGGFIRGTSSATEHSGKLFMGNLIEDYISVFDLSLLGEVREHTSSDDAKEEL